MPGFCGFRRTYSHKVHKDTKEMFAKNAETTAHTNRALFLSRCVTQIPSSFPELMNSGRFGIILLALVAVVVIAAFLIRRRNSSEWGFKDVLKNPQFWDGAAKAGEEFEAAKREALGWSDEKVAAVTKHFIFEVPSGREAGVEGRVLQALGARTHPTVIEVLRDASARERLIKVTSEGLFPEAPFNRACELLGDAPPTDAVEVLRPFLEEMSTGIRKEAVLAITKTGADTIVPDVKKAFGDTDEYVRSYALIGLEYSLNREALSERVCDELFPEVIRLLREDKNADKAADILYRLDEGRALQFFLADEVFRADSPILHVAVQVLADAKVSVPRERIHALIASLERGQLEYPRTRALAEALRLLGQQGREEDRNFLQARTEHSDKSVREGAAAGMLAAYGVEGADKRIWEKESNSGYDSLSRLEKLYQGVFECDGEINNGGLSQYFVNSSGDHWRDAVAGFKEMRFTERLKILEEAIAMFGNAGPATDRRERQEQLSRIHRRKETAFDELDTRYYKCPESVRVFAARFAIEHAESFK
jgi:HEAT repeat protein